MSRITLRLAVAALTFVASLTSVWFAGLLPRFESLVADLVAPTPDITLQIVAPSAPDERQETSAVYAALIREVFISDATEQIVIEAKTRAFPPYEDEAKIGFHLMESREESVRRFVPGAVPETVADYVAKNRRSQILSGIDGLNIRTTFLGVDELKRLFPAYEFDRDWKRFYAKYPNSSGIISLSRVGFNRQYDQAVVFTARSCGGLCGAGTFVFLMKRHGVWTIRHQAGVWVS